MQQDRPPLPSAGDSEQLSDSADPGVKRRNTTAVVIAAVVVMVCLAGGCISAVATGLLTRLWAEGQTALSPLGIVIDMTPEARIAEATALSTATAEIPLYTVSTPTALIVAVRTATPAPAPTSPVLTATPQITHTSNPSVTAELTARQVRVFEKLWDIVDTNYIYPDFHGLDWDAVRKRTLEKINAGIDDEQFYDLMRGAVDGLNDHHSSFLSPQEAREEQQDYEGTGNYTGIGIITDINSDPQGTQSSKRYAYVLQVLPGSPAEQAGIRAHEHILTINGLPSVLENDGTNMPMLRGPAGSTVTVTVSAQNGKPRTLMIKRAKLSTSTPVEHHIITGTKRIGYLMIPTLFEDTVGDEVRAALDDMMKKGRLDGLIIDVRINGGGAYPVLMRCLGFFTSGNVGTLTNRRDTQKTLVARAERVGNSQSVPIMVLAGHATASYAEVFAGILRTTGRAKLIGQKTGGNIETLHAHEFEDGSLAWIAEETFRLPNGSNWEGEGLDPDIKIDKAWDEITADSDPGIVAALKAF